jgi:Phasin protein
MSSIEESKPAGKSGRRQRKGEMRREKSAVAANQVPVEEQASELNAEQTSQADPQPPASGFQGIATDSKIVDTVADDAPSPTEVAATELSPVDLRTIANAYRDYTRKSFEEFGLFFEQLSAARSLAKAMEIQSEFVKRAYENSVAESQRIRELHRRLASQTFQPFQGLIGAALDPHGKS